MYVFTHLSQFGGVERVFIDKINYYCNLEDYEVFVYTVEQKNHPMSHPIDERCHVTHLGIRFTDSYKKKGIYRYCDILRRQRNFYRVLRDCIDSIKPDVILSQADFYCDVIADIKGNTPFIIEAHSSYDHTRWYPQINYLQRIMRYFYFRKFRKAQKIVCLTEGDALLWKKRNPNVQVIPNVVHLNEDNTFSICKNKRVIFVGRFAYQKGWWHLFDIWSRVHKKFPDWSLEIYGEGEDELDVIKCIKNKGIEDSVNIHKPTSNIFPEYKKSSILMLTSIYEPFGLVLPEAMSCGLPVISFRGEGPDDIITDGEDGFLVEQYDIDSYCEKLSKLMESEELRKRMGEKGIISSKRYSADKIMPQWLDLFENLTRCGQQSQT